MAQPFSSVAQPPFRDRSILRHDRPFVKRYYFRFGSRLCENPSSNGPLLVRSDTDRLLKEEDLISSTCSGQFFAWDSLANCIVEGPSKHLALRGEYIIATVDGAISCQPVFERYAVLCKRYTPEVIEATCWIPRGQLEEAAEIIWHSRPVSYYAYSGHEHHANATDTARAMAMLYALTGSFDSAGGNVLFPAVPASSITGEDLPAAKRLAPAIGFAERPLGPARWNHVAALVRRLSQPS